MIRKIRKRDGKVVDFNPIKITDAIWKAAQAVGGKDYRKAAQLTDKVLDMLEKSLKKGEIPTVELVQDIVEKTLIEEGHARTAKAYILYRKQHQDIREIGGLLKDIDIVDGYLSMMDWKVNENSNMAYSLQGLNVYATENIISHYWLNKIYPPEIGEAHKRGSYHIHDLGTLGAYTYYGKETVIAKIEGKIVITSFQDLYEKTKYSEEILSVKDDAKAKYPKEIEVLDKDGWTKVFRVVKKARLKQMRYIKNEGGRSVIVTEDHPMLMEGGCVKQARNVKEENDKLLTVDLKKLLEKEKLFYKQHLYIAKELYDRGMKKFWIEGMPYEDYLEYSSNLEINGIVSTSNNADSLPNKIELTENLGYLVGFYIAEGNMDSHRISIKQKNTAEKQEEFDKLTEAAYQLGCRIYTKTKDDMLELRIVNTTLVKFLLTEIFNLDGRSQEKRLPSEILTYNQDFINGLISGILDGDGSIATSNTSLVIRTASRTMLEQIGLVMNILGFTVRDRNLEGVGSTRIYNGRDIVQNYPLYGISFRTLEYSLPSLMYNNAQMSTKAWRTEGAGWHKVLNNEPTEIMDDYIYDITTESNTLIVNGMWNHNCVGWDLKDILLLGFRGVSGKIESKPAKHFSTALMQIVNYLYTLQGEAAGAQALSNFDSLLAPFIRYDGLNYKDVKQEMQKFLFNMNVPTRVGFQSLAHDEPVVFRKNGKIKTEFIGKLIEENFGENRKSIISNVDGYGNPSNDSFAVIPNDKYEVISFNKKGQIQWQPVKALIKHRVQTNGFKRIRTGSGDVKVSPAHSLFRSNDSHIKPVMAKELECAKPNSTLNGKNHILAVNKLKQNLLGNKESIDLFELIEELPEKIKARIFVKAKDVPKIKEKIGKLYGSLKEFVYKNGRTDKSTLYEGFSNNVVTFETYIKYSDEIRKDVKIYIKPYNENLYERNLSGEKLASFVKLVAWFITEGKASHSGIVISQEKTKSKEILDIAKSLGINVTIEETKGYSNKTKSETDTIISNMKMSGLYTYLLPYLAGATSKEKTVPSFIFDLSSDFRNIFLGTLFKGDGYFDKGSKRISYSSMSDKLLTAISMLSIVNDWRVRVIPKSKGRAGTLLIYKNPKKELDITISETAGVPVYEIDDYKNDWEWEYDISVDIKDCEENFVGGTGLVFYHNSPFTNITLDLAVPDYMKDEPVIIGGELKDDDYIDFSNEIDMINKSFAEIMYEGDAKGRPFSVDGNCLCPIKNSGHTKLVRIGEYIDSLMEKNTPVFYKENGCEVLDVRGRGLKCSGIKDGKVRWENINYVVRHPQKELFKITTKGGFNIGVTSSHSLFILRQGKIQDYPASELKEGDYLISPRIIPSEEGKDRLSLSYEFIRKGKVDGLFISRVMKDNKVYKERRVGNGKKIHQYKVNVFPLKNIASNLKEYDLSKATLNLAGSKLKIKDSLAFTKELIEFLGWYCAEGSAEIGKKYGGISLGFNLSKEKEVASHIAGLVKKIFKVPVAIREIKERNLIEVRVHSKLVRRILLEVFEVGNKKCKRVPSFIFETSFEKKRLFLNAYFKGDAYITEDIVVNSNSEELIYGVSTLLKQLDIFHTLTTYTTNNRKYWRINIWNNKDLVPKTSYSIAKIPVEESGLCCLAAKMVEKNPFYYDIKKRRYKNTIHRQLSKFGITNQESVGIKIAKKMLEAARFMQIDIPSALLEIELGNLLFFKIKNIEKTVTSNGWVYDFSSDTENFIAHQFLVHNTFPIPTINITKDFNWDNDNLDPIWNMTAKYGIPYFSNFINSDMKPDDVRSMCCRLRISNRELKKRGGGLFGAHPKTGCYDEKTEVLTENGWKFFKDVNKNEKVFSLTKNNEIKLQKPTRFFEYDYDNEMYHFKTRSFDLLVTPNHRMLIDNARTKERKFVEAKDFVPSTHRIPKQGIWNCSRKRYFELPSVSILGGSGPSSTFSEKEIEVIKTEKRDGKSIYELAKKYNCNPVTIHNICKHSKYGNRERVRVRYETPTLKIKMDNWLKFFGFWLAEGCTDNEKIAKSHGYRTVISQVNKQKRKEIKKVLDCLPFNYYLEGETNFVICNKQLWSYLRQFGNKYTKFIPREIKELHRKKLKILFDWMIKGDGHIRKSNGQINYWTASKKLADDVQEVVMKLGWLATIKAQNRNISEIRGRKVNSGIVYTIGVHRKSKHFRLRQYSIMKKHYEGKVYCLEVPSHTLYVRRNGKPTWCGNSIGVVTINVPQIGYLSKDENDFFERIDTLMDLAKQSLEIKRELIENLTFSGLHPYSRFYLSDIKNNFSEYWKNHFSTIGIVGMNDALLNFMNKSIGDKEGKAFAEKVLDHMREKMADYQQETGNIFNLEATPAEGSLAPDEKVLISQSDPRFNEIGPLVDNYLENNKDNTQMVGTSEVLKIPYGKMFTYGFSRKTQKIKKYPVTALVRHPGKSMYSIKTTSGRSVKVTGQHSVFTLDSEGKPTEVLVSNLNVGAPIAIPKKIQIETANKDFNLIELFKKSSFNKYLYAIFPISFIEKLIKDIKVKKWCDKNYKFKWSDIKGLWMKRRVIPLKLIYDLNIKIDKKTLMSSKIFYRYTKNTRPINVIIPINEDFGFTVGCLLSEGWLTERCEFNNTDKEFAKKFLESAEKTFGSKSAYLTYLKRKRPRKNIYLITLSKSIGLFFKEIGLVGKSNEKQVPNFVFSSNLDCAAGLLKGYYLGDGSFYKNKRKNDYSVDLFSNSKKLIDGLNLLLLRFGVLTKIREDKKSEYNSRWNDNYCISITGAENLEIFFTNIIKEKFQIGKTHSGRYTISEVPKLIKKIMQKHKIKPRDLNICKDSINKNVRINRISIQYLQEIVNKLSIYIKDKDESLEQLKRLVNSDIYWDKIKEIKELKPTKYVYDFEVDVKDDQVNNFLGGSGLVCLHNTSYRLARIDKSQYPDIRIYNQEKYNGGHRGDVEPYYTNSTQLPVGFTDDIFEALDLQDSLQSRYTGGTVLHIFISEHDPDPQAIKKLIRKIAENYTLPYYTITPTFSICPKHGYLAGEHKFCPKCDEEIGYKEGD